MAEVTPFFSLNTKEEEEGEDNTQKKIAARKKCKIRRSKKNEELLKALPQSTDILQDWAQIVSDLELQDTDQEEEDGHF